MPKITVPEINKVTVARLDAFGIYQGIDEICDADLTDAHVQLPNGCDLPHGKYRWDKTRGAFVAIDEKKELEQPPDALRALAIGFIWMHDLGMELPAETLAWLDSYTAEITGFSEPTQEIIKRFQSRK